MSRFYDKSRDASAIHRLWIESGWLEDKKDELDNFDAFLECASIRVSDLDGEAESVVATLPGDYQHGNTRLPFSIISSVNTGRIGRKQGLATKTLSESLGDSYLSGAVAAGLGIFDQGFYDRVGFGTTGYERWIRFDPSLLLPGLPTERAVRLDESNCDEIHAHRLSRMRYHGSVNVTPSGHTRLELKESRNGFGLGIRRNGDLVSHFWFSAKNIESGPYSVYWHAFTDWESIPAALGLLTNLGDQVHLVHMREPVYLQMQDFVLKPLRNQAMSAGARSEQRTRAKAYHQMRILDLRKAVEVVSLSHGEIEFNLQLSDPVESHLSESSPWRGCGGDYTIRLGKESMCAEGHASGLPLMSADIGTFTRFWAGVLSPRALSVSKRLTAPEDLLRGHGVGQRRR